MVGFDPSRAVEDFAQRAADFERQANRFQELQGRMTALVATESSSGGRVSVTVDGNGVPTAIDLSASTRGMDPAVVSAEIMSCLRRAQARLRAQVAEMVQDTVGDDAAGAAIVERFAKQFPDPDPTEAGPPAYTAPPPSYAPPPVPSADFSTEPGPAAPASEVSTPTARSRKPNRDQIVTPDEPDPDEEYYRKSWLV
ncbi:YbaB/EbfC family nucleoid-associated protein [Nocardia sp. NBC_00881]|uniref:YbaB/EbfC family nucleoid-associated protein n=1 Tax=Nocardia sp. NBC_00881 TaxID=2975995 RepID=UPI00386A8F2D|nr:YbaB/EbfC family nucleoid-associated protein [Nocardia sp. NBC_00881]